MKSLVMVANGEPFLAMLRGDHQLSKIKFARFTGASDVRQARVRMKSARGSVPRLVRLDRLACRTSGSWRTSRFRAAGT